MTQEQVDEEIKIMKNWVDSSTKEEKEELLENAGIKKDGKFIGYYKDLSSLFKE